MINVYKIICVSYNILYYYIKKKIILMKTTDSFFLFFSQTPLAWQKETGHSLKEIENCY